MALNFNKVIIAGVLVKDPELRYTQQGKAVTEVRVAINDGKKQGNQTQAVFVDVTFWEKQAEVVCEHLRKGSGLLVDGKLGEDRWRDKDTGKERSKLKVVGFSVNFTDSRRAGEGGQQRERKAEPEHENRADEFPAEDMGEVPF